MKDTIEKRVVGLFFLMLAILVGIAWYSIKTINASVDKTKWVNHTRAILLDANTVISDLHAGDASMTAYLLTGDNLDQVNYRSSYKDMVVMLDNGKDLTRSDVNEKGLHEEFLTLEKLIGNHINFTRDLIKARDTGGIDAARQAMMTHPAAESTTDINYLVSKLNEQTDGLLSQRDEDEVTQAHNTTLVIYLGVVVNFMLLVFVSFLIRSEMKARHLAATALEEANAQLETKVQERTAELVKSNQALKKENLERRWSYQALDHQLRYNQLIVNSISEMVFVVSKALNVSRVNPAVTHISKWEAQDVVTQSIERVLQVPADGPSNPLITALNDGRELQERPGTVLTKTGATLQVRFNLVPLRDDNKIVGGVVTVRPWFGPTPVPDDAAPRGPAKYEKTHSLS